MSNDLSAQKRDVVIIGAGPAGLGAARTLARLGFDTLVVERGSGPGELTHPADVIVTRTPGLGRDRSETNSLRFPQIDLTIPPSLILARRAAFRLLAPNGSEFPFQSGPEAPAPVLIDKIGLLRLLARQAEAAGAEFLWGTAATSLISERDTVAGVRTPAGDIAAQLVIQAAGGEATSCDALAVGKRPDPGRYLLVFSQDLEAPLLGPGHVGCLITLGRSFGSADSGFGTLVASRPGRATMMFMMPVTGLDCGRVSHGWRYLAEYAQDPRIARLLRGACVLRRSSWIQPFGRMPESAVGAGLMVAGNAATPCGRLDILQALYLGRQAALVAAAALDAGDTSALALAPYDTFLKNFVIPGLEAEAMVLNGVLNMSDSELDRLCSLLIALHLPLPGFAGMPSIAAETIAWLGRQLDLPESDRHLLARLYAGERFQPAAPAALPVNVPSL